MKEQDNKIKVIHIRMSESEYNSLHKHFSQTTCRKFSQYLRKLIFGKAVTVNIRNASLDDFMTEIMLLKKELSSIGNNINQAVKKLHTTKDFEQAKNWYVALELERWDLHKTVDKIQSLIEQKTEEWLQK